MRGKLKVIVFIKDLFLGENFLLKGIQTKEVITAGAHGISPLIFKIKNLRR